MSQTKKTGKEEKKEEPKMEESKKDTKKEDLKEASPKKDDKVIDKKSAKLDPLKQQESPKTDDKKNDKKLTKGQQPVPPTPVKDDKTKKDIKADPKDTVKDVSKDVKKDGKKQDKKDDKKEGKKEDKKDAKKEQKKDEKKDDKATNAKDPKGVIKKDEKDSKSLAKKDDKKDQKPQGKEDKKPQDNKSSSLPKQIQSTPAKNRNNKSLEDLHKSPIDTIKSDSQIEKKFDEDVVKSSGLLDAYERIKNNNHFLRAICKNGLPTGDVFEFAAQQIQRFEKKKRAKELKERAEAHIRKAAFKHKETGEQVESQ